MTKFKRVILIPVIFLCSFVFAQNVIPNAEEIIKKSSKNFLDIKSIEYEIIQKPKKGSYGYPIIKATIVQQKDNTIKDIGFGKATIKVQGTIKEKGITEPFSFSYDGKEFMYTRGKEYKLKKIISPSRKTVMGNLQQWLFMLRIFEFTKEDPYKSRWGDYVYEGLDYINNEQCYNIKSSTTINISKDKVGRPSNIWWLSKENFWPTAYSDGINKKLITIKGTDKKYPKSLFSLDKQYSVINEVSNKKAEQDVLDQYILKKGAISPKWSALTQSGEKISSESLKGKIVFIDFWGTGVMLANWRCQL